ncbi:hypothetical protein Pcinc_038045 [Petrolisthes cinctipes]|uniref:Uncharacterized protein n=1 Tax=Petrolisthes cinctipes TaxID=88211 RepID=A0AAE1EKV4_PETCI|nr:hypothetical protein Pcinc_038045 [Petrolisthes cinctipes]
MGAGYREGNQPGQDRKLRSLQGWHSAHLTTPAPLHHHHYPAPPPSYIPVCPPPTTTTLPLHPPTSLPAPTRLSPPPHLPPSSHEKEGGGTQDVLWSHSDPL